MTFGDYLLGVIGLALVAAALGSSAVWLRRHFLPGWGGAPARLVEAVIGISLLTVISQLLGGIGVLERFTLVLVACLVPITVLRLLRATAGRPEEQPPSPPVPRLQVVLALGAAAFLFTHWALGLEDVWGKGMFTFDTLWYHGPFAARIAHSGSAWPLHFTDPLYLNWFYPENSELLHADGILLFGRDLISPLINFGWLGLALLAAWCIGRPYGVAPLSLVAVALILDTGPMIPREAGTMANDIAPISGLLAASAILINGHASCRGEPRTVGGAALLFAGLAAGLALGTKMTIAAAVLALAVGVAVIARPGRRRRALGWFVAGVAIPAGFWFLRNLIDTGNPLPWINHIGPIDLPGPGRGLEGRDPFSVAHYIFVNPDTTVWRLYFFDGVRNLLGPGWFLFAIGVVAGALLAILRPRSPVVRLCGAVAVVAAVAYAFTPLTAAGPDGQPTGFTINFRYLVPALALSLSLLPLWAPVGAERVRPPRSAGIGFSGDLVRLALLIGGLATLAATAKYSDSASIWNGAFASAPAAVLIGLAAVGGAVGLALLGRRSAVLALVAGAFLTLGVAAVGWAKQDDYLRQRYAKAGTSPQLAAGGLDAVARWAKPIADARVAVAGTSGAYNQYLLYGDRLSNYVQYVGREGSGGNFTGIGKCEPWIQALNEGGYDFVVTTPNLDLNQPATTNPAPEGGWVRGQPNARQVLRAGRVAVFRLTGPLDPGRCRKHR